MLEASPFWQTAFLIGVLVSLGWCIVNGWRIGLVRAIFVLLGSLVAAGVGIAVGAVVLLVGMLISPILGLYAALVVGGVVVVAVYLVAHMIAALLFKRTGQQPTFILRLVYGGGGALVGIFVGLSMVWGALFFIRGTGGFYEYAFVKPGPTAPRPPTALEGTMIKLKRSIEAGSTGKLLESVDIMPRKFYRILDKVGALAAKPAALSRLTEYPPVIDLMRSPKFVELTSNVQLPDGTPEQQLMALMKDPKILAAAQDPALIAAVEKIDIEKALDFALAAPAASPTP